MKKGKLIALISSISLITLTIASVIIIPTLSNKGHEIFEQNEPSIKIKDEITIDSGMIIDGIENEEVYKSQASISFTETISGITCTSKAFLGDTGVYLYAYVDDHNVYVSSERQFYENDSVEFYIDPNPKESNTIENLEKENNVRTDCVQLRINPEGDIQTWFGRRIGKEGSYPWSLGYFDAVASAKVNGDINKKNGTTGYSVEAFIPYYEMKLEEKPSQIGLLVAFNNIDNREDTARTWFSYKGMSHQKLTSYIQVNNSGFIVPNHKSKKELTADYNDTFYSNVNDLKMYQVDENNENPEERASFKFLLGEDGVYLVALVKDRVYSYSSDGIFSNDGIEVLIDTRQSLSTTIFEEGVYRFSYDIAGGCQTDKCIDNYNDYVSVFDPTLSKTKIEEYNKESIYGYKYQYTYEAMIPYEVIGLSQKPKYLNFSFAVKTPNEKAYILNRMDNESNLEGQDWLWIDKHYPQNPKEYFVLDENGAYSGTYSEQAFDWSKVSSSSLTSECLERYNYQAYAASNGLFINMVQYVDNYYVGNVDDSWLNNTHIEMEIWHHGIGYGWDGTYFAFFLDGSYYINNRTNIYNIISKITINQSLETKYLYEINYEIYISFDNNLENPLDGPYGYVKFMSYTPKEGVSGYNNATLITKDNDRVLWTDDCNSYGINKTGIYMMDRQNVASSSSKEYNIVNGNYTNFNNKIISTEFNSLALIDETSSALDYSMSMKFVANSNSKAGLIFDYKDINNYQYFAVDGYAHEIVLSKVINGMEEEIERNYISASYKYSSSFNMKIEVSNDKFYCYFFNTMYFSGNMIHKTYAVGFASSVPGAQYYDIEIKNEVVSKDVDTLIIGHSYTELWENYQQDFSIIGLGNNISNIGISGSHSFHWNKLKEEILEYSPELLVYNIGINDLLHNTCNPRTIVNNIKDLLLGLKSQKSDLEVALLSLNHCVNSYGVTNLIIETNNYMKEVADEYEWIKYVDLENAFCDEGGQVNPNWFTDGLHPTKEAYKQVIIPAIAKVINFNNKLEQEWDNYKTDVTSSAPDRYQVLSHAADNGLYIYIEQYVDNYVIKDDPSDWNSTHVEMELWNGDIGYGWGGTYFAFFANGTYYINSWNNCSAIYNYVEIKENDNSANYKYTISYNIFIEFPNNLAAPQDGPYAYCKFMFMTPNETNEGYENVTTITKDGNRTLWTDKCNSYEIRRNGIVRKEGEW